jgi:hypothetical protein
MFILQGAVTFVVAILGVFTLPDDPLTTRWLTPEERQLANDRIVRDTVGEKGKSTSVQGLLEAAKDKKLWLFAFMQHMRTSHINPLRPLPLHRTTLLQLIIFVLRLFSCSSASNYSPPYPTASTLRQDPTNNPL